MSTFVDEAQICAVGGDGGAGCVAFRREAHTPMGGPDGGDGGTGGSVWLVADRNVASLLAFRDHPHRRATKGRHGQGKNKHGAGGKDLIVAVPEGTVVRDQEGGVVADLVRHGDRWLAAEAGRGGRGNARFASAGRRAPGFAEQGEAGEENWFNLELKLMADVAIVGFPNVGKSTLISRLSAARPKIADYPFTTLEPQLGVVRLDDGFEMVLADIPGLIEGAAEGRGLGFTFLRHIERARVLLLVLDTASVEGVSTETQEEVLLTELGSYRPDLLERERVRIGSRADVSSVSGTDAAHDPDLRLVSSATGQGIDGLVADLRQAVERARADQDEPEAYVVHRPVTEGFRIERNDDGSFEVIGREARRAVALSDLTNLDALAYAQDKLASLGVDKALARGGAKPGDTVHIGKLTFEYEDSDVVVIEQRGRRS